ncbi:MAG: hypothetical protein P1U65_12040 [Minwuia sp.]|nr:hypothetical protein [Minwuia sp.]
MGDRRSGAAHLRQTSPPFHPSPDVVDSELSEIGKDTTGTVSKMGATANDRPARSGSILRRLAVPIFLSLVIAVFGTTAYRALPDLPILTRPEVEGMPFRRMFSTALYDDHAIAARYDTAITDPIFMSRLSHLLAVERMARRSLAQRPIGSRFWYHRSAAAHRSGRASDARTHGLRALSDGPFSRTYAADRVAIAVRYWDDLTEAERDRAYAYMRKMVYYTDSILVAQAAEDQPGVEDHLWTAVAGDENLEIRLGVRLRNGKRHLFRQR